MFLRPESLDKTYDAVGSIKILSDKAGISDRELFFHLGRDCNQITSCENDIRWIRKKIMSSDEDAVRFWYYKYESTVGLSNQNSLRSCHFCFSITIILSHISVFPPWLSFVALRLNHLIGISMPLTPVTRAANEAFNGFFSQGTPSSCHTRLMDEDRTG